LQIRNFARICLGPVGERQRASLTVFTASIITRSGRLPTSSGGADSHYEH